MKSDKKAEASKILRQKAEVLMSSRTHKKGSQLSEIDAIKLVHELEVYQIELELQNEELFRAKTLAAELATEKYAELYDFAPTGYFTLSREGNIIELNLCGSQMLGKERSRLTGSSFGFFVSNETRPVFNHFLSRVFNSKKKDTCELTLSANGNIPVQVHLTGIITDNETKCLVTVVDISQIKELKELNEILLSSLPHPAMYIRQKDRVVIAANKIAKDLGVNVGGHCWSEFMKTNFISDQYREILAKYPEDDSAKFRIKCSFCLGDQCFSDVHELNIPEVHAFGQIWNTFWVKVSDAVFLHYAVNITENKKAEKELQKSEEKYRSLVENMGEGVGFLNKEEVFLFANSSAEKIFGVVKGELEGLCLNDFLFGKNIEIIKSEIHKRSQGESSVFEHEIILKDGSKKDILITATPSFEDGIFIGTFAIFRDYTERKQVEDKLRKSEENLRKINDEKDKFFSIIAHDLRSPFNGFLGLTEIMAEGMPRMSLDEIKKMVLVMRNSATTLFRLLGNLLEWARMQRGLTTFVPVTCLLMPKISENLLVAQDAADKKEITISYDVPENLMVYTDLNMFGVIFRNLMTNAVKFTPKGGSIAISAKPISGNMVGISIRDTGIGMTADIIDNLFRIDINTSRKGTEGESSTGLGLIICKDYIEKHGGQLYIESEEGKGSTFRFTLPKP